MEQALIAVMRMLDADFVSSLILLKYISLLKDRGNNEIIFSFNQAKTAGALKHKD